MEWGKENKSDIAIKSLCLLLSPILGILASLPRINTRSSFVVLFISLVTFGFSLCTPDVESEDFNYDSVRYRRMFEEYVYMDYHGFVGHWDDYVNGVGKGDFFLDVLIFVLTRYTSNYHVLFMVVACLFALFLLKSLRFFVSETNYHFSLSCILLLFVFTLAGIDKINIIRWFLAYWLTVYALFRIYIDNSRLHYVLLCFAVVFHGSFIMLLPIIIIAMLIRHFRMIIPLILILSLFLSPVILKVATRVLPMILGDFYSMYTDYYYVYEINESGSGLIWLRRLLEVVLLISNTVIVLIFTKHYHDRIKGTKCESLYYILISIVLVVNLSISIPSVGSRFIMLVYPLLAYIFLVCFYEQQFRNVIYMYAGFILCCILTFSRYYMLPSLTDYLKLWHPLFYVSSPVYSFFKYIVLY